MLSTHCPNAPGIPVATVAIDGAKNAALLAVQIMGVKDKQLQEKMAAYKQEMSGEVAKKDKLIQQLDDEL